MFSDLPKLLDRNFAVGYFLPAAIFLAATDHLLQAFGRLPYSSVKALTAEHPWLGAAVMVVATWVLALLLLGANRSVVRLKEGYGLDFAWNPLKLVEKWRFQCLERELADLLAKREAKLKAGEELPATLRAELIRKGHQRALRYPDEERFLLPTAFGNTIRAFEVYPRVMYGVESTEIWSRLLAVVPKEYRELVDLAKSQVDFWVNSWAVLVLLVVEYGALQVVWGGWQAAWLPAVAVAGIPFTSYWSRKLAEEWGGRVKTCFDVFLPELRKKLELGVPASRAAERELWGDVSKGFLYRLPAGLPERAPAAPAKPGSSGAGATP